MKRKIRQEGIKTSLRELIEIQEKAEKFLEWFKKQYEKELGDKDTKPRSYKTGAKTTVSGRQVQKLVSKLDTNMSLGQESVTEVAPSCDGKIEKEQ